MLTGQNLASVGVDEAGYVYFNQGGCGVWHINDSGERGWEIIKDGESNITKLKDLGSTKCPPGEITGRYPPGYKVMDGWIIHSSGKQLLWLPPHWWPGQHDRIWSGQFLALVNEMLPQVLILELE